ncbi:ankyrin repeat domain-containing protein [Tenacibaculum sp. 190524A05c]|uniref:Ankyrin repeat protein n=1 Tax=Tenacibaculum platacis TaxID=3137852 RepID=A0ABM9NVQ3_9FLAO
MKRKSFILLVYSFLISSLYAQVKTSNINWNNQEYTSIQKLEIFAKACNAAQIKKLLQSDPNFEINYGQITLTPVQLAIDAFIKANNKGEIWKCDECINSVVNIMKDKRYDFRLQRLRTATDLIYAIKREKDLSKTPEITQRFEFLLYEKLKILDNKPDFDIQYSIGSYVDALNGNPGTAFEASSAFGTASFCLLTKKYSILLEEIDKRSGDNKFTPLMLAARFNNLYTAERLLFYGADYLKKFTGYQVNGIPVIGISNRAGNTAMTKLLIDYKDGKHNATGCK